MRFSFEYSIEAPVEQLQPAVLLEYEATNFARLDLGIFCPASLQVTSVQPFSSPLRLRSSQDFRSLKDTQICPSATPVEIVCMNEMFNLHSNTHANGKKADITVKVVERCDTIECNF